MAVLHERGCQVNKDIDTQGFLMVFNIWCKQSKQFLLEM